MTPESVPDPARVGRALTKRAWVLPGAPASPPQVAATAFLLERPQDGRELSASLDLAGLFRRFRRLFGLAVLRAGDVRGCCLPDGSPAGLEVLHTPDESDPHHVSLTGMPSAAERGADDAAAQRAYDIAEALAAHAALILSPPTE